MYKVNIADTDLFDDLEVAYYEYNSYFNIINTIKNQGYDENYWDVWFQYMEVLVEYETLKERLRVEIIVPVVGEIFDRWEVNFEEGVVYIYTLED